MGWNDVEKENAIEDYEHTIELQQFFVDYADCISQSVDVLDIEEMVQLAVSEGICIDYGKFIWWLRNKQYITDDDAPYTWYIRHGYMGFVEESKKTAYGDKVFKKIVFTGKGQIWIIEQLRKVLLNF